MHWSQRWIDGLLGWRLEAHGRWLGLSQSGRTTVEIQQVPKHIVLLEKWCMWRALNAQPHKIGRQVTCKLGPINKQSHIQMLLHENDYWSITNSLSVCRKSRLRTQWIVFEQLLILIFKVPVSLFLICFHVKL